MSIIPTTEPSVASNRAKTYLKQYKSWILVSLRQDSNHSEAIYQCKERLKVVEHVKGDDLASGIILDCRFIKKYSTQRTIEQLASHNITITVSNFYHRQRKALLMAYELMPKSNTKIVK
ncbi:MAG TPA: hypothetical protein K8V23_07770 [Lactobacillus crispatus]|uniref:Uncharacterized protein n=1 Tax=Lactobacillus crispatus TaxID=47770 RepID=A0A921K5V7_9LACO|nr:hypothetical protein [Limosilactobacillus vaginalis]HJF10660.1 hypothetical protein [Lactobacillus crispatus]